MKSEFRIDHPSNEASGLLGLQSRAVLRELEWQLGFWIVWRADSGRTARLLVAALVFLAVAK